MKLHQIIKGTRSVKNVPFRVSNAPTFTGDDWEKDENTILVGIRALTPGESSEVLAKAQESAAKAGAKEWLATHPLCELHLMVHLVAVACVDSEAPSEPFFVGGAKEILDSPEVAGDNLAYLAQQAKLWNDQLGPRDPELTTEQLISVVVREAERPENAPEAFFSLLRPSSQLSCFRSLAKLLSDLLITRSLSGLPESTSSSANTAPTPSENESPATPTKTAKRKPRK
jgi:hypothetical protein